MPVTEIHTCLQEHLEQFGFEAYPFKIGWYNDCVTESFLLHYEFDTLAFIIISTPDMFEKAFKPFVCGRQQHSNIDKDLIDECMIDQFLSVKKYFPDEDVEIIHDFELHHSRRPKILVQTAGHVAGAAFYYQRSDLNSDPWDKSQKIFGVSVHPRYGGWFALRGVLVFKNIKCEELVQMQPTNCVKSDDLKKELLENYNFNWQDWTFRDVIPVTKKYSEEQKTYFATLPVERNNLIKQIKAIGRIVTDEHLKTNITS